MNTVMSNKHTSETATLDDDAPQEHNCTTPIIPINVISDWVLPFVLDRRTWNAVCSANKELHEAGMRMPPPWPDTNLKLLGQSVGSLKFSPCGSFLASGACISPYLVHICDRRGRQTCLTGHTSGIVCLSFSNDGNYLASAGGSNHDSLSSAASGGHDASIRIWLTNSSKLPYKTLRGQQDLIHCLEFTPGDSNLLASGDSSAVKLWNIEQEACIYSFIHSCGRIRSMYFPALDEGHKCIFSTARGSLIRTCWNDLSVIASDIVDLLGLGQVQRSTFSHCGSLLAASSCNGHAVTIYNMRTMTVVQRLSSGQNMGVPYFLAFSPDGKTLVLDSHRHEIQICEVHDLNISRRIGKEYTATRTLAVAFEPSGQFLASAGQDQNVRLWTLE